ncbi:hypothetical protein ACFQ6E_16345 [Streptomyces sp. NPDC056462]|uniref:RapZ C-terminal domain-containing protein n=1 Tax=Streptomyces sp. NPDC056462 TaxID=3345826 RepID=UPI003676EA72
MTTISITSYGTSHNDNPAAPDPVAVDTTLLHNPPDAPSARADLTQKTGRDIEVARYVMAAPGADHLVETAMQQIRDRLARDRRQVDVHVSCFDGRARSVAVALELAFRLRVLHAFDGEVHVTHRHVNRPVLPQPQRLKGDLSMRIPTPATTAQYDGDTTAVEVALLAVAQCPHGHNIAFTVPDYEDLDYYQQKCTTWALAHADDCPGPTSATAESER